MSSVAEITIRTSWAEPTLSKLPARWPALSWSTLARLLTLLLGFFLLRLRFVRGQCSLRLVEVLLKGGSLRREVLDLVLKVFLVERLGVHTHLLPHVSEELSHGWRLGLLCDDGNAGFDLGSCGRIIVQLLHLHVGGHLSAQVILQLVVRLVESFLQLLLL